MSIRANGIPLWITILAIVLALYCTATGVLGLFDPSTVGAYIPGADNLAVTWSGRMAGTGAALAVAVFLRSANAYAVAFAASIMRELGDAIEAMSGTSDGFPVVVVLLILALDIVAFVISLRAGRKAHV